MKEVNISENIILLLNEVKGYDITAVTIFSNNSGSRDKKGGLTNLALKVGLKRSLSKTSREIAFLIEPFGSSISSDVGKDFATISFQTVSEGINTYFSILSELIENPAFTEKDFTIEKETYIASIRARLENPFSCGYEQFLKLTYKGTPYGNISTVESVSSITLQEAKKRYKDFFKRGKFVISVSGKIPSNIEEIVSKLPFGRENLNFIEFEAPVKGTESLNFCRNGSTQTFIIRGYEAPSIKNWKEYIHFRLLNGILGEGFNSVLFQELREKRGFAYSTGSFFSTTVNTGRLIIYIGTSPEKEKTALEEIDNIWRNLPDFITEDKVERAKNYLEGIYLLDHELRIRKAWYSGWWKLLKNSAEFDRLYIDEIKKISTKSLKELAEKTKDKPYHQVVVCNG